MDYPYLPKKNQGLGTTGIDSKTSSPNPYGYEQLQFNNGQPYNMSEQTNPDIQQATASNKISEKLKANNEVYDQAQGKGASKAIQQGAQEGIDQANKQVQETSRLNNLGKGLTSLYEGVLKIPRFAYSVAAIPQNALADVLDSPSLRATYDDFLQNTNGTGFAGSSPLVVLDQLGDYYKGESKSYEEKTQKYDENIMGSIGKGKWGQAGSQILDQITESAPSIAGMAMTAGAGNTANLGQVTKTIANALPFMSQKNAQLQDRPDVPEWLKPVNATFNGLAEVVFDQKFGTQAAIQGIVNKFTNEGREAALEGAKELVGSFVNGALKTAKVIKPFATGAIEEGTTQLAQNIVDKYTTDPNKDLMEDVGDAMVVGAAMTGGIESVGHIISPKAKKQITDLHTEQQSLLNELGNPNLSEESRKGVEQLLNTNQSSIESIAKETQDAIAKLNPEQKKQVDGLSEKINVAEQIVNDPNTSEEVKKVAEKQIGELGKEIDAIKPEEVDTKKESVDKPKEAVQETISVEPKTSTTEVKETIVEPENESYLIVSSDTKSALDSGRKKQVVEVDANGNQTVNEVDFTKDDADLELDRLESLAKKGRLTPEEFQRSFFGQSTTTTGFQSASKAINENPTAFIENLRKSFDSTNDSNTQPNEVKPVQAEEVVKEDISQKRNEEVLTKAEDDLTALKQVTNKVAKHEASLKRLTEAKNKGEISEQEFTDLKNRFDDVLADSLPANPKRLSKEENEQLNKELEIDNLTTDDFVEYERANSNSTIEPNAETVQQSKDDATGSRPKDTGSETTQEPERDKDSFSKLVHKNIQSEEISNTLNNVERETGRTLDDSEKEYQTTKRMEAIAHGAEVVREAKVEFGDDYATNLINYLDENKTVSVENRSLITISLELDLEKRILEEPENAPKLEKQLKLVRDISTKNQRSAAIATGYGILRHLARVGYDVSQVTNEFFSSTEREARKKLDKTIQSDADAVNKEAEKVENDILDIDIEEAIAKGVEKQVNDIYEKLPSKRREQADKAIAALDRIQKKLRSKTYDASIGVPVAIIDAGITTIKAAIKAGVSVADAIELGINKIKEAHGKKWAKEKEFRQDMLDGFKEEQIETTQGSRVMTDEQRRKAYIARLNKDIQALDEQIDAGERKVVTKEDKYANDEEVNVLRETRDAKKEELDAIDSTYKDRRKLETDLKLAEKSLAEYERRIADNDFDTTKPTQKELDAKLKELRDKRDDARTEFNKKKAEYEKSLKQPTVPKTDAEKLAEAKERVKERIKNIQQQIADKKKELTARSKVTDPELQQLEALESTLKKEAGKYLTNESKAILEEQKKKTIVKKLENEITDIDKQISEGEKKTREAKKDPYESPEINRLKAEKKAKLEVLELIDPTPVDFVRQALIDSGYGREIKVKGETKTILDWKKLAGEEGSIDRMRDAVGEVLKGKGYSDVEIERLQDKFTEEYNDLRASIIEKSLNELNNRNTEKDKVDVKASARRLAELYNYGLFDKEADTYDYLMNSALGMSIKSQQIFFEAKEVAKALSDLYSSKNKGKSISDIGLQPAINTLNHKITHLLNKIALNEANWKFKVANIAKEYVGLSQRFLLVNLKNMTENIFSGYVERVFSKLTFFNEKTDTKALRDQRRELATTMFKDITLNGGLDYGNTNSPFLSRSMTQDFIDSFITAKSKDQAYHAMLSYVTGRAFLEGTDSMHKSVLTEKLFVRQLVKVLTNPDNPNHMGREEAVNYVSEQLTGQTFKDAQSTAKEVINNINSKAGKTILPDNKEAVYRLANSIVKDALVAGTKLNTREVEASLSSAYKVAGFGMGHEANNPISKGVGKLNVSIEQDLKKAIQEKKWNTATALTFESMMVKNIMNPFVGGGMNWVTLTLQKAGLGVYSAVKQGAERRENPIDLTTMEGIKNLEKSLTADAKAKSTQGRVFIGAVAGLLTYTVLKGTGGDDDLSKWLKKNEWIKKYFNVLSPQMLVFLIALKNDELKKYAQNILNVKTDQFSDGVKFVDGATKLVEGIKEGNDSDKNKGLGKLGDVVGGKLSFPLPYKFTRDIQNLYNGLNNKPQINAEWNTSGFLNGFYRTGLIEFLGLRPDAESSKPLTKEQMEERMKQSKEKAMKVLEELKK